MARNVARQRGEEIRRFTTAVFDLVELPADFRTGTPSKDHPQYYYRPWKTILVRTVADGGRSYYFSGDHRRTIPTLWREIVRRSEGEVSAAADGAQWRLDAAAEALPRSSARANAVATEAFCQPQPAQPADSPAKRGGR
jgi:hypothetical protein